MKKISFLIVIIYIHLFQVADADQTKLDPNVPVNITVGSICQNITNSGAYSIFAPSGNASDFSAFLAHTPAGITTASCTPNVNGVCGTSNGASFSSIPSTNLCSSGTSSTVSGSGPWSWSCNGSGGGSNATCVANTASINGVCGTSNGATFSSIPSTNLCSSGTSSTVAGSGPWSWSCNGSSGGSNASCVANAASINGVCGTSNGATFAASPTSNLCSSGTATPVTTGVDPWSWSCNGSSGGSNASCIAYASCNLQCSAAGGTWNGLSGCFFNACGADGSGNGYSTYLSLYGSAPLPTGLNLPWILDTTNPNNGNCGYNYGYSGASDCFCGAFTSPSCK